MHKSSRKKGWLRSIHVLFATENNVYGCVAAMSSHAKIELIHESMKENQWGITESIRVSFV